MIVFINNTVPHVMQNSHISRSQSGKILYFFKFQQLFAAFSQLFSKFPPSFPPKILSFAQISFLVKTGRRKRQPVPGGNMWESNPPGQFFATLTGFEDRGAHQHPSTPMSGNYSNTPTAEMQAGFTPFCRHPAGPPLQKPWSSRR